MKILLIGQDRHWALERVYRRHLSEWCEVELVPVEDWFDDFYQSSLLRKVQVRLGLSDIYRQLGRRVLDAVDRFRPDVALVFKGMSVLPEVLEQIRARGIMLANYNPDHPFLFSSRGSGNENVSRSIGLYDLHLSYSRPVLERIRREYGIDTGWLPFGFELPEEDFSQIESQKEEMAVCFVGNPDPSREAMLTQVAAAGFPVVVHGHGWRPRLRGVEGVEVRDAVYGLDYWRTLRRYRVQLNIFRAHNVGSHNMRTFEVPAAGGIMLAPHSEDHRDFFAIGEEIFTWQDEGELLDKIASLLALSAEEAGSVRTAARRRCLEGGYSYRHRAKQLLESLTCLV